ncbi:DUF4388 domain-containing protein [Oculatella sp. LEGE 06141]|uniref:DUF4388 domain-containing protein n=1 Tax=Oculatella sp. LEGE 06141 TaxID=1828648 RepID=UPI001881219A|nr:DUF4388 domain-containing protein [Oculatella sp. LEGE 06141]MBE9183105.1 DUF4388 domain-containing protein [Oculatella sp. LEGE 06141]
MAITGRLSVISLPEILQILDRGRKTGLLTIQTAPDNQTEQLHYVWLSQGRIVAAAHRLDHTELVSMLVKRKWIEASTASELRAC